MLIDKYVMAVKSRDGFFTTLGGVSSADEIREAGQFLLDNAESIASEWRSKREPNPVEVKAYRQKSGYVYLMKNSRNGLVKIGYSINVNLREKTLQSEEPEVELLAKRKGTLLDERKYHERFRSFRVRGEWFQLPPAALQSILQEFQNWKSQ